MLMILLNLQMESLDFCGTGADFSITSGCLTRLGEESLFPTICSKKFSILRVYSLSRANSLNLYISISIS